MNKSQKDPDVPRCLCGRERSSAAVSSYRSPAGSYALHRCDCGAEWTEHLDGIDHSAPVSPDEVLEVHERLARFQGTIADLLGAQPAS